MVYTQTPGHSLHAYPGASPAATRANTHYGMHVGRVAAASAAGVDIEALGGIGPAPAVPLQGARDNRACITGMEARLRNCSIGPGAGAGEGRGHTSGFGGGVATRSVGASMLRTLFVTVSGTTACVS
jgi:hypothetical protein